MFTQQLFQTYFFQDWISVSDVISLLLQQNTCIYVYDSDYAGRQVDILWNCSINMVLCR